MLFLADLFHVVIQEYDIITAPDVLVDLEVAADFADDLEIHAARVILFRLGINDPLRPGGIG